MGGSLIGSAPQASFSTQPTVQPQQLSLLQSLMTALQGGAFSSGVSPSAGAPVQSQSLQGLENIAAQVPQQGAVDPGAVGQALTNATNVQFPRYNAPPNIVASGAGPVQQVSAQTVGAQPIDATEAFRRGVIEPMTSDFMTQTLPAIAGQFGRGAGGAYSSDALGAREQAGTNLDRSLAQTGAQFAYDAARANQAAALQAALANQSANLTAGISNQGQTLQAQEFTAGQQNQAAAQNVNAALSTNALNAGVTQANQDAVLRALGLAPSVNQLPFQAPSAGASIFESLLSATGGAPFAQNLALLTAMLGGATTPTQQTLGVGTGGSSGLLPGLFSGLGSAFSGALGERIFSDERLKEDFELVGNVGGFPLYKYRFKGEPENVVRLGVKAQEVERTMPEVVSRFPGTDLRMVDYGSMIERALEAA